MIDEEFQTQFVRWTGEMRELARQAPCAGAVAAGMELWSWTLERLRRSIEPCGAPIFREARQSVTFAMADALCELLAVRSLTLDVLTVGPFYLDLGMIQSAHAAGRVAQICSGLIFGHDPERCV